jgi:hypothetical protein
VRSAQDGARSSLELDVRERSRIGVSAHAARGSVDLRHTNTHPAASDAGPTFCGSGTGSLPRSISKSRVVSRIPNMTNGCPPGTHRGYAVGAAIAWCTMGAALVASVLVWKLAASTYRADIAVICGGERIAGLPVRGDMAGVSEQIRARLATPEGNRLFSDLRDLPIGARAERLRAQATATHLRSCPMADTYQELAAEAEYRSDVQQLCSYVTFPGLQELDDRSRIQALTAWIREAARSDRTSELQTILRRASASSEAAKALRAAAAEIGVFTCDTAKVLDHRPVFSCAAGVEVSGR